MIEYLNKFSKKEVDKFRDFVSSPYYNTNKSVIKLFNYLASLHPNLSTENTDIKIILRKVFRMGRDNASFARKTISRYRKVFDRFLIQLETETGEVENSLRLLKSYNDRNMPKEFEMLSKKIKQLLDKNIPVKDHQYYENKRIFLSLTGTHKYLTKRIIQKESFQGIHDNLDHYYFVLKLGDFNTLEVMEFNSHYKVKLKKTYFKEIISTIESNKTYYRSKHHLIYMRYLIIKMFEKMDDKYFHELLDYHEAYKKHFKKELLWEYRKVVGAYMSSKTQIPNRDNLKERSKLFELYDKMLMKKTPGKSLSLFEDNLVPYELFRNCVLTGLFLRRHEWVKQFMEKYNKTMHPEFSKDINNLSLAGYHYYLGDYVKALNHAGKVSYRDYRYYYFSKRLTIKIYVDSKNIEPLKHEITIILNYLNLKKDYPDELRKYLKTFIKFTKKLIKLAESDATFIKYNLGILRKEIDNEKELVDSKDWFYEKLTELAKVKKNQIQV